MTTHDLAAALTAFARLLRAGPNINLSDAQVVDAASRTSSAQLAVSLGTLMDLSKIDKARWVELISDFKLPIEIRPSYSARDVVGKLFNYLEQNPAVLEQMKSASARESKASPELMKALNTLLRGTTS